MEETPTEVARKDVVGSVLGRSEVAHSVVVRSEANCIEVVLREVSQRMAAQHVVAQLGDTELGVDLRVVVHFVAGQVACSEAYTQTAHRVVRPVYFREAARLEIG